MGTSSERIRASGLTKRFSNGVFGLEALSLTVREGELVCLFGGPGAGKSTALHLIAGLMTPSSGTVTIDGSAVSDRARTLRRVTLIARAWKHPGRLNPIENLRAYLALNGKGASVDDCRNALRDCGVPDSVMKGPTSALTREHQLLIWFALARMKQAGVLLLDDPAWGLDVLAIRNLLEHIDGLRPHVATLVTTSNPLLAADADRCLMLIDGRPVWERTKAELTAQSLASVYVRLWGHRDLD
jgi:ABC-type multidrug transport system ATPase subunit